MHNFNPKKKDVKISLNKELKCYKILLQKHETANVIKVNEKNKS